LGSEFNSEWEIEKVAREFRIRMMEGQTMNEHNMFRREIYRQVVRIARENVTAEEKVPHPGSDSGPGYISPTSRPDIMTSPRHKLVQFLKTRKQHLSLLPAKKTTPLKAGQVSKKTEADYPLVILAFDEAHALTN
jgi:hypothetical protein